MVLKVANPSQLATYPRKRTLMKDYLPSIKIGNDVRTFDNPYTLTRKGTNRADKFMNIKIQKVNLHCDYIITYFTTYDI